MIEQFRIFLGPARLRALIILLALTGLFSLILNAFEAEWVTTVQTLLVAVFLVGAVVIIGGRLSWETRLRWLAIAAPAVGALILGLTVLPHLLLPLVGAAVGWVVAGALLFRPRVPREFQLAIRHMRKGNYDEAVKAITELIKDDPQNTSYYRLRAEIFRLWGKLDRARKDYEQMTELDPESAVGFNGLAEVHLQSGRYTEAQQAGQRALELAPAEWVALYNLGMIEDRLGAAAPAVAHLNAALEHKIPDARHRLLIHLYLARAYWRMGDKAQAEAQFGLLRKQRSGLEEWQNLLKHEEAAALRAVLADDIALAQKLVEGDATLEALAT